MVLARKKRGGAPPPPPDLTGGHPFESPANPRKKRFGDESDDDGGDDETQMKGYASPGERASSSSFAERRCCRSGAGTTPRDRGRRPSRANTESRTSRRITERKDSASSASPSGRTFSRTCAGRCPDLPHVEDGQPCRRCAGGSTRGRRRAAPEDARADGRGADRAAAAPSWRGAAGTNSGAIRTRSSSPPTKP